VGLVSKACENSSSVCNILRCFAFAVAYRKIGKQLQRAPDSPSLPLALPCQMSMWPSLLHVVILDLKGDTSEQRRC
jgi:hypothetical protein